jgi:hypothetical protein
MMTVGFGMVLRRRASSFSSWSAGFDGFFATGDCDAAARKDRWRESLNRCK